MANFIQKKLSFFPIFDFKKKRQDDFSDYISETYNELEQYLLLSRKCLKCHSLKTDFAIAPPSGLRFEDTFNEVQKYFSSKKYQIIRNKSLKIDILYYRTLLDNHKVKCHHHFFNNKLFLSAYTFPYLDKNQRLAMIEKLRKNYAVEPSHYLRQNIIDNQNNYMQFNDSVEFTINYVSLDCDIFQKEINS